MAGQQRDERQTMRQRGAATRKVDNVDFGLRFGTPSSRRSRSATPRSRTSNVSRSRTAETQRYSTERSIPPRSRSASVGLLSDAVSPAKRRKIVGGVAQALSGPQMQTSNVFPIIEDSEREEELPYASDQNEPLTALPLNTVYSIQAVDLQEEERGEHRDSKPPVKRKKRKSIIPAALRKKKRPSGDLVPSNKDRTAAIQQLSLSGPVADENLDQGSLVAPEGPSHNPPTAFGFSRQVSPELVDPTLAQRAGLFAEDFVDENVEETLNDESQMSDLYQTSNDPTQSTKAQLLKKRKKRKSVNLVKPKRRKSGEKDLISLPRRVESIDAPVINRYLDNGRASLQVSDDANKEDNLPLRRIRRKPRRQTLQSLGTSPMRRDADEASEEEYNPDDHSPDPETPAPRRKAQRKTSSEPTVAPRDQSNRKRKKESFPITTHRLANIDALPTIVEDDELQHNPDHEVSLSTLPERHQPNNLDILAQICREVVSTTICRLSTSHSTDSKADIGRKRNALQAFGDDLDQRLTDMSTASENKLALEARVKKAKRDKTDLQSRWIDIRKEREKMALRCDKVRAYHWDNEKEREEMWAISEAAWKAELELGRGETPEEASLEFQLAGVAQDVGGGHRTGLLARVKDFNGHLERLATVLEGRS